MVNHKLSHAYHVKDLIQRDAEFHPDGMGGVVHGPSVLVVILTESIQ